MTIDMPKFVRAEIIANETVVMFSSLTPDLDAEKRKIKFSRVAMMNCLYAKYLAEDFEIRLFDEGAEDTKGELFRRRGSWQSARTAIAKNARAIYYKSSAKRKCFLCEYDKHFDVCHIKDVSEFDNSSLISEINDISNLIGLCKNHHWEFDHNSLEKEDRIKIERLVNLTTLLRAKC